MHDAGGGRVADARLFSFLPNSVQHVGGTRIFDQLGEIRSRLAAVDRRRGGQNAE